MKPTPRIACHLLLTTALFFTPCFALAQSSDAATDTPTTDAPTTDTTSQTPAAMPTMAEVEQAYTRGDFVFVRSALQKLAETDGSALAQYRFGRVLAEGRGGPRDYIQSTQ